MSHSASVLIAGVTPDEQQRTAEVLAAEGFSVVCEADAAAATKQLATFAFDAVLLDASLVSGEAARLRGLLAVRRCALIFVARPDERVDPSELRERLGALACLRVPVHLAELLAVLRTALGARYPSWGTEVDGAAVTPAGAAHAVAMRQSLRGELARAPFPEVLAAAWRWRASGALLLSRGRVKKIVYLTDGLPRWVKSNVVAECLGRVLVSERLIRDTDCDASVRGMRAMRRRQGTLLVEMGALSEQNLAYGLALQLRTKLFDVFGWEEGEFRFVPGTPCPFEPVELGMSLPRLLHEGVRRVFTAERLARHLGRVEGLYPRRIELAAKELGELSLGVDDLRLLLSLDGRRSAGELRAQEPLDLARFLFAMQCAGLLELLPHRVRTRSMTDAPAAPAVRATPPPPPLLPRPVHPTPAASASPPPAPTAPRLAPSASETRDAVQDVVAGDAAFREGVARLEDGDVFAAHAAFRRAVQTYPRDAEFHAYLGWSRFSLEPQDARNQHEARALLETALALDPACEQAHLFLGHLHRAAGRVLEAEAAFSAAQRSNTPSP